MLNVFALEFQSVNQQSEHITLTLFLKVQITGLAHQETSDPDGAPEHVKMIGTSESKSRPLKKKQLKLNSSFILLS